MGKQITIYNLHLYGSFKSNQSVEFFWIFINATVREEIKLKDYITEMIYMYVISLLQCAVNLLFFFC